MKIKSKRKENKKQYLTVKELRELMIKGEYLPVPYVPLKSKIKHYLIKKIQDF